MASISKTTYRRLRPLYIAAFFQGFVLWYAIDKLMAEHLGVSPSMIGLIVAAMTLVSLLFEIPSGILADQWSRKKVLLVSMASIFIGTSVGALASARWHYFVISAFWGIFFAMYSGTYEALVYDVLVEEKEDTKLFEKYFGKIGRFDSIALACGAITGGLLASTFDIHTPYIVTLPMIAISALSVALFKEPLVHKKGARLTMYTHVGKTFKSVVASRQLIYYFLITLFMGASIRTLFEFNQLWFIELKLPLALFGIATALITLTIGVRSIIVDRLRTNRDALLLYSLLAAFLCSATLSINNRWLAVAMLILSLLSVMCASLVLSSLQQAHIPSSFRAGATSILSTLTHLMFVPVSIVFGFIAKSTVLNASYIITGLLCSACICAGLSLKNSKNN